MKWTRESVTGSCLFLTVALAAACASDDGDDKNDGMGAGGGGGDVTGSGGSAGDTGGTAGGGATGGGATGGGGSSAGGSGGGGPASVCDGTTVAPESASVSDLEDGTAGGWDIYASTPADATDNGAVVTAPASGSHDDPPEVASEGGDGTSSSVHYAGTGWQTYGAGMNYNLEGCKDLSEYTGVRFWARGSSSPGAAQTMPDNLTDNSLNFRVITAGSHAIIMEGGANVGGDCDAEAANHKCFMPPQTNITLTDTWTLHEIPFTDLVVPAGANPGSAFSGDNAMLLGWHSDNADFDVYIDEVAFY